MTKNTNHNYKVTLEYITEERTKQDVFPQPVVSVFSSYLYGYKNAQTALSAFIRNRLPALRKNGLKITKAELKKIRKNILVERI